MDYAMTPYGLTGHFAIAQALRPQCSRFGRHGDSDVGVGRARVSAVASLLCFERRLAEKFADAVVTCVASTAS